MTGNTVFVGENWVQEVLPPSWGTNMLMKTEPFAHSFEHAAASTGATGMVQPGHIVDIEIAANDSVNAVLTVLHELQFQRL